MSRFFCWSEEDGPEEAREYTKWSNPQYAAEEHAEFAYGETAGECGDEQVIHVRDDAGPVRVFDITTDREPTFIARERQLVAGGAR